MVASITGVQSPLNFLLELTYYAVKFNVLSIETFYAILIRFSKTRLG
jgi:hypothetical protein